MKFTKYRKPKVYKSSKKSKVVKKSVSSAITKYQNKKIEKVIGRMAETKIANYAFNNFLGVPVTSTAFQSTIKILNPSSNSGSLYNIQQGTGQGARVGNKITTSKCLLKCVVHINTFFDLTTNYNPCPLYVVLYVVRLKPTLTDDVSTMYNVIQNSFFQAGNSSAGFTGTLVDMMREPNRNQVVVLKKKVVKVGTAQAFSAFATNSPNNANQQYTDSTVGIARMYNLDLTDKLYKNYEYNDSTNTPTERQTYIFWVPFRVDGSIPVTSTGNTLGPQTFNIDLAVDYHYYDI